MKFILLKISVIFFITVSIDYSLSLYLDNLYKKNEGPYANGHFNYYLNHVKVDTLFIGSSRVMNHVDTRLFSDKAYNLSHASMHIGFQAALIDVLEKERKLPKKTLFLHIEANELGDSSDKSLLEEIQYLNYYYSENDFIKSEINQISSFEFVKHWSKLYRFSGYSSLLITNPIQNINQKPLSGGFHPLMNQNFNSEIDPNFKKNFDLSNPFFKYLNHISKICKRNNIQLICFTTPYFTNEKYEFEQNKILGEILKKNNYQYLNYSSIKNQLPNLYENNSYWYDNSHLNQKGAKIFTLFLKNELKSKIN